MTLHVFCSRLALRYARSTLGGERIRGPKLKLGLAFANDIKAVRNRQSHVKSGKTRAQTKIYKMHVLRNNKETKSDGSVYPII